MRGFLKLYIHTCALGDTVMPIPNAGKSHINIDVSIQVLK